MENNKIKLAGIIKGEIDGSRELDGEKFYDLNLEVKRLSGTSDILPVTIPEKLLSTTNVKLKDGVVLSLDGEFRSHNKTIDNKSKLMLFAFAKDIQEIDAKDLETRENINTIYLSGTICKEPIFRTTPFGKEIADVILAVNRNISKKSDYIPLIAWGRNARYLSSLSVGTKIAVEGRVQSREYEKKIDNEQLEKRIAYEVSVSKLENLSKKEEQNDFERERA